MNLLDWIVLFFVVVMAAGVAALLSVWMPFGWAALIAVAAVGAFLLFLGR